MLRTLSKIIALTALVAVAVSPSTKAQDNFSEAEYYDQIKIDRYLDVEIWTNHADNEFYDGDNIVLNFRTSRDAFVAIYSIDSKGRVNLLFPASPADDNFVRGGVTNHFPGGSDDFDLVVSGPDGVENIQAIASRERFPIPDWYPTSGLICDWEDRFDYMDAINAEYFVRYAGQRFAFDRTSIYVNHWEPEYYRPIYRPVYPSWTVCGNVYIDYPWGGTVYINGVYWGIAPLYIPRIFVGWHTFTIYDYYGYCWEYPVHITRYNTIVLDHNIIVTSPTVVSKYKEVRTVGYRDPVLHGYPKYKTKTVVTGTKPGSGAKVVGKTKDVKLAKSFVRGSAKVVKSQRGYESAGGVKAQSKSKGTLKSGSSKSRQSSKITGRSSDRGSRSATSSRLKSTGRSSKSTTSDRGSRSSKVTTKGKSSKSSDYYQRKSSSSTYKGSSKGSSKSSSKKIERGKSSSSKSSSRARSVERKPSSSKSSKGSTKSTTKSSNTKKSTTTKTTKDKKSKK